ncbi:asparaginase [Microbulbifer hydrolyticus]|uniref:Asparaginase n=1 Tax=Microbulbifer hydrolyticus TaxID=48074 RepID=A0A6P1T8N1_9GAMM|nr:asparaginase domain-containing protein [Microbulbifer hydrolyticus]MBB5211241.1 L-asparaginase [Microbulbifer hydrolyticus]QHQ37990.1 asparaginase [Microbulbifer hydrolyticus]
MTDLNQKATVRILTTGGTIEKSYCESEGTLKNRASIIREGLISSLRLPYTHLELESVLNKDSLEMDDNDRMQICSAIAATAERGDPIVILHGTDTMSVTAEYCYRQMGTPKVPVVFTGAMKPMGFIDSDARQNVTEALLTARLVEPGFYIAFHNRVFPIPGARKNLETGTFEAI